jgi:predicted ArsR family transcriptional regulator
MEMHPNGIRIHLDRLEQAGMVVRGRIQKPRGRPLSQWSVSPDAQPGGSPPRAYGDLARWLARAIPPDPERLAEVEEAGREIGREIAPHDAGSAREALRDTLSGLGFQPTLERDDAGGISCTLENCPYRNSVKENREVVCTLHRGITRGVLDVIAPDAELTRFIPRDPETAGCEVGVDGLTEGSGPP